MSKNYKIHKGYKLPDKPFTWKRLPGDMFAVKVDYTDEESRQLYAVFDKQHIATGEHLTLEQVIERSKN